MREENRLTIEGEDGREIDLRDVDLRDEQTGARFEFNGAPEEGVEFWRTRLVQMTAEEVEEKVQRGELKPVE